MSAQNRVKVISIFSLPLLSPYMPSTCPVVAKSHLSAQGLAVRNMHSLNISTNFGGSSRLL